VEAYVFHQGAELINGDLARVVFVELDELGDQ
jgi:hypothetical protein